MPTSLSRRGLGPAALGAEGQGSCVGMVESGPTCHLALGEVQPQARSKSQATHPSPVGMAAGSTMETQDHGGHAERGQEWVPHAGGSRDRGLGCIKGLLRQPRPAAAFWKLLCPSARAAASRGTSTFPSHLFHSSHLLPLLSIALPSLFPSSCGPSQGQP